MSKYLNKIFDEAFANPGMKVPVGKTVLCDGCGQNLTDSAAIGGFIFLSKSYGPCCAGEMQKSIDAAQEQRFIRGRPEPGESFADFIRRIKEPAAFAGSR